MVLKLMCGYLTIRALRQANELAEGQKSTEVKHQMHIPPPSASSGNWRRGSNFPRKTHALTTLERHLAEGVVAEFFAFFANFTTVGKVLDRP